MDTALLDGSGGTAADSFAYFEPGLTDILESHARWRPNDRALMSGDKCLSWRELHARVQRLARALEIAGLSPGSAVAVLGQNRLDTVVAYLGVVAAGGVVCPLSTQLPALALHRMIEDAGAAFLLADYEGRALLGTLPAGIDARLVALDDADADAPWRPMTDFLAANDGLSSSWRASPDSPFSLIYTSGTTGIPKGMVHTHRSRLAFAARFAQAFAMNAGSVAIAATALFTTGTWLMWLPALHAGAPLFVLPSFSVEIFLETAVREGATHTFLVPAAYAALLDHPAFAPDRVATMETWVSAGSALPVGLKRKLDALPGDLVDMYGCSEGFTTVSTRRDREAAQDLAAVGSPPFGWDVRVIDDAGREAAPGELGELAGRSEFMLSHYHGRPEATRAALWRSPEGEQFIRSGDLGRIGPDGQVYVVDRKKDVINSGGMNVFAADLEGILLARPDIAEAAVVAGPHPKWGETPVAFVVPVMERGVLDVEVVRASVNGQVANYQRLSRVVPVDRLPRNALGKVIKRELRDRLKETARDDDVYPTGKY